MGVDNNSQKEIAEILKTNEKARNALSLYKAAIDPYVTRHLTDSTWIVSRLQMYWKTHSSNVYIKGGVYDHADGNAPVPTVRFPGTRDGTTNYGAPKLEDIMPYMDDPRGLYLVNRSKPGQPLEWAEVSKTGRTVDGINSQILGLANNAAIVYWITGEEKYARFAYDIFDTYMTGMYYRSEPVDVTHGHHQTIVGLSTFEVIQESAILNSITGVYDYLYNYIKARSAQKILLYAETLKKWADLQIKNGVAFNNWDLIQARNILTIGMVLEDNNAYPDGKGNLYYIDQVLNKNSERQWSIVKLLGEGYDPNTGIWYECPGYSLGVLGDFTGLVNLFDSKYNDDILPQIPVVKKAVLAAPQYLFPNGYISAFGDTHYTHINTGPAMQMVQNAQKNNKPEQEAVYTSYLKTLSSFYNVPGENNARPIAGRKGLDILLLKDANTTLNPYLPAGRIEDYVSPTFFAPNVSYFAQRNGFNPKNGLMVAMAGSKGNHAHANGISMEIFGKGLVLGPEGGIGTSYFQTDYAEYYSQFPAHNTVIVDGKSAYPVMKSNHGFDVLSSYPLSGIKQGIFTGVTYGDLFFIEPETMSDQDRLTSIIKTNDSTGYYVDIFRSKKKDGSDKMHDYIYHNLGQQFNLTDKTGTPLNLTLTEQLAFASGTLDGYDYFYDKKVITTDKDVKATFTLNVTGRDDVMMNMWIKGSPHRNIFSVKAPPSKAFSNNSMVPDSISALPLPTIVARQYGEAWDHPFVVVYEPSTSKEPTSIKSISSFNPANAGYDFVGLKIEAKTGSTDYVFSSASAKEVAYHNSTVQATYAVIRESKTGLAYLFMGNGNQIATASYQIETKSTCSAALIIDNKKLSFTAEKPAKLTIPDIYPAGKAISLKATINGKQITITGKRKKLNNKQLITFAMPAMSLSVLNIISN